MKKGFLTGKLSLSLVAVLLLGMGYLGLIVILGTSSPFMLVRGSSMKPTIHAGDLLLSRSVSPDEVKVGDVIAFSVPADAQQRLKMPAIAVHRVVGIEGEKGQLVFVTKGDNSGVDPFKVPGTSVKGAVVKNLGPIGRQILFLTNRAVLLLLGLPILTFILVVMASLWLVPNENRETAGASTAGVARTFSKAIGRPLDRLTSAISKYGVHLQSHTSIIKLMAGTSQGLDDAVHQQNEILAELTAVVREMNYSQAEDSVNLTAQHPRKSRKKSANRQAKPSGSGGKKSRNSPEDTGPQRPVAQAPEIGASKSPNAIEESPDRKELTLLQIQKRDYPRAVQDCLTEVASGIRIRAQATACLPCLEESIKTYDAYTLPELPLDGCSGDGDGNGNCTCLYETLRKSAGGSPGLSMATTRSS